MGASFATSPKFGDFRMEHAQCMCGALRLTLPVPEAARLVVVCHCLDCQRRSGGPFGLGAFYPAEFATISGDHRKSTRSAASGGKVHNFFVRIVDRRSFGRPTTCQGSSALLSARWRTRNTRLPLDPSSNNRNITGFRLTVSLSTFNKVAQQKTQSETRPGHYRASSRD